MVPRFSSTGGPRQRVTSGTENFRPQNRAAYSSSNTISHSFEAWSQVSRSNLSRINPGHRSNPRSRLYPQPGRNFFSGAAHTFCRIPDFALTRESRRARIIRNRARIWKGNDPPGRVSKKLGQLCLDLWQREGITPFIPSLYRFRPTMKRWKKSFLVEFFYKNKLRLPFEKVKFLSFSYLCWSGRYILDVEILYLELNR